MLRSQQSVSVLLVCSPPELDLAGAGFTCVVPLAQEGERCGGFDGSTGITNPDCDVGLFCMEPEVSIPGAGNMCVAIPIPGDLAQEGEPCGGF